MARATAAVLVARVFVLGLLIHVCNVTGFIFYRCAGEGAQSLLHEAANLELDGSLLGYVDRFQSLGVLRFARSADLGLENAEVAELQAVASAQLADDLVEEALDNLLDL